MKKIKLVLMVVLFGFNVSGSNIENPNFDFSGMNQFWKIVSILEKDIEPTTKQLITRKQTKVNIQDLKQSEVDLLIDLQPTGWRDIIPMFDFYTKADFCFPVKATIDNKVIGIGTTIIHNDVAWLAHIIVHPDNRNRGVGLSISRTLVDSLKTKKCNTIYLIATDLGAPVYEKIGFETETEYLCFKDLKNDNGWTTSNNITLFNDNLKGQIAHMDQQVSGEDRMYHFKEYLRSGYVYMKDNIVEGFYLPTLGEGLITANTGLAGLELMKLRLKTKDNAVFPSDNLVATEFMHQNNYKAFEKVKRMRLGKKRTMFLTNMYNRIGGNLG